MRSRIPRLLLGLTLLTGWLAGNGQAQVTVTVGWNGSASSGLAGYYLVWGTNSGVYFATNTYPATQFSGTISNLTSNVVYYIAVAAYNTSGLVSPYSTETVFSNNIAPPPIISSSKISSGPPMPPGTTGLSPATHRPGPVTGGTSLTAGGGGGGAGSGLSSGSMAAATSTNLTQAQIWGVPPMLGLVLSNGQPVLNIAGTIGSTVLIQGTTNLTGTIGWITLTNVYMTNPAPIPSSSTPGVAQDAIDLAYQPAIQSIPLPTSTNGTMQHFRGVLAYDYVILAGEVLPTKGYSSRLILVNMPGLTDDGCYVTQSSSFIHYSQTNTALQLISSGSTIRQIASTLANYLNLDWTTASEFTYSNGMGQILATVVEADPPSSDPVAGTTPTSSIVINF